MKFRLFLVFVVFFSLAFLIFGWKKTIVQSAKQEPVSGPSAQTAPANPTPFLRNRARMNWAEIESTNLNDLITNLRMISCPEGTINYVVHGRLNLQYARKLIDVSSSKTLKIDQLKSRDALRHEIESIMYNNLGLHHQPRTPGIFFNADEERLVAEALDANPDTGIGPAFASNANQPNTNRDARIGYLKDKLSEDKLTLYKLDREEDASVVQFLFRGYKPAEPEFMAVATAYEKSNARIDGGGFSETVAAAMGAFLAPDVLALLQGLNRREVVATAGFGRRHNLSPESINSLIVLRENLSNQTDYSYSNQVQTLLVQPDLVQRYLKDKSIHPSLAK